MLVPDGLLGLTAPLLSAGHKTILRATQPTHRRSSGSAIKNDHVLPHRTAKIYLAASIYIRCIALIIDDFTLIEC
jgi:hypothetical protein